MDNITINKSGPASHSHRETPGTTAAHGTYPVSPDSRNSGKNGGYSGIQRRSGAERRSFTLRSLACCLLEPRRSKGRRREDRRFPLLDVFDGGAMFMAVSLMFFSLADAMFTLHILARGGTEVNPVMNYFLGHGVFAFVSIKVLLTAIPAIVLVASGNYKLFSVIRVRSIMAAAIGCYAGLIVYEIGLLTLI